MLSCEQPEATSSILGGASGDCHVAPLLAMTSVEFVAEWWIPMLLVQVFHPHAGRVPLPTRKVELGHPYFDAYALNPPL
ncbi:hypothetical protein Desti_2610 [Desulfomonile tiedjei DSM 6799]|uniref:Uncharacterized protein n=1 Tax=Desulfomonile tiedjei (strain ATCC 49306 / DSM 6799 / DCB-1) TaxID=706587 RepID=I4C6U9_DESTA|nr:hypothetical protein Desti_2610 [Desulfomonile tiedjei DSM 6799]